MTKFKHIFDNKLRPGTPVLSRTTDEAFIYVQEYIPGLTSLVRRPYKDSPPFLIADDIIVKFRGYQFFQWLGEKAGMLNKRLGRMHAESH